MLLDNPAFPSVLARQSCILRSSHLSSAIAMFRKFICIRVTPKGSKDMCLARVLIGLLEAKWVSRTDRRFLVAS